MPTIIVTGSNGFIGTNVLDALLKYPFEGLLRFLSTERSKFKESGSARLNEPVEFICSDLENTLLRRTAQRFMSSARVRFVPHIRLKEQLDDLAEPPLIVIHNGACSSTTETRPSVFQELNLEFSKMIWTYCTKNSVPLVYASSASVYGDGTKGFSDDNDLHHQYVPLNLYGKSKYDFDAWALMQKEAPPSWFGLRYFNVYGPFESHKEYQASMVFHSYHQILKTGEVKLFKSTSPLYEDGKQKRDFVYVGDVIDVTIKILSICLGKRMSGGSATPLIESGFYNVGSGTARTWHELVLNAFNSLQIAPRIQFIPMPNALKDHYQNFTEAKMEKLQNLMGPSWAPTPIEKGVYETVTKFLARGV